jgi:exportin-1
MIVCLEVVNNFASIPDGGVSSVFFQRYFLSTIQDIFFVLTDADHKSGFKTQSMLLARMIQLVELNMIQAPLFDPSKSNAAGLREYCANLLKGAFPHVQPYVVILSYLISS